MNGWMTRIYRGMAAGLLLALGTPGAALAAYQINLYQTSAGGTVWGVGGFGFTNPSAVGTFPATLPSLATTTANPLTPVTPITFDTDVSFTVATAAVDFFDGKAENNHVTGIYTEGAIGRLSSSATGHTIDFAFIAAGTDPAAFTKSYEIRDSGGTLVQSGVYGVQNTLTIPEPNTLAIFGLGLVVLAALAYRNAGRRRGTGDRHPPNSPA